MTTGPELWLGDLARAVERLRPADTATADAIARLLGFETTSMSAAQDTVGPAADVPEGGAPEAPARASAPQRRPAASAPSALDELRLLPSRRRPASGQRDYSSGDALPPVEPKHLYTRFAHEPLFEPRRESALLQAAIAVDVPGDELDEAAAIDAIAAARALVELPLLARRSLARGAQLLVDDGPGMDPFARDVRALVATLRLLTGRSQLTVRHFEGSPLDGDYRLPPPGTPVLAVSDLGAAPVASGFVERDWIELAALLREQDSHLTALNPYGGAAVPGAAIAVVRWDRATTVAGVFASRERVH